MKKNLKSYDMAMYVLWIEERLDEWSPSRQNGKSTQVDNVYNDFNCAYTSILYLMGFNIPRKLKKRYKRCIMIYLNYLDQYFPYKEFKRRRINYE